ncbi:MAG: magnesium/cobalt transporter CorA [Alphaproteobacteria bacterium]
MKKRTFYLKSITPAGTAPGVVSQQENSQKTELCLRIYDKETLLEYDNIEVSEIETLLTKHHSKNFWLNINGLGTLDVLEKIAKLFKIHLLAFEDVINTHQTPKIDEYNNHLFLVFQIPSLNENNGIDNEQISMFLGNNYLITFNPAKTTFLDPIIIRLQKNSSAMRNLSCDYLTYAIIDKIIDTSFPILQYYGDKLDEFDEEVINPKVKKLPLKLHTVKRDFLTLKRLVFPESEVIKYLLNDDNEFISDETKNYLKDCFDHSLRVIEMIEVYRETASSIMELFLSISASRMNDVIKVLTVISTIFIPLGVIAGIYGMNFDNMPELHFEYGYFTALGIMLSLAVAMLAYFGKKGWLSKD